jgi:hypothetical protein
MTISIDEFLKMSKEQWPRMSLEQATKRLQMVISSVERYGLPGSKIEGSRQVRWYCTYCGRPMRVPSIPSDGNNNFECPKPHDCEGCDPYTSGSRGTPQQGNSQAIPVDDITGYQANAIRDLEQS